MFKALHTKMISFQRMKVNMRFCNARSIGTVKSNNHRRTGISGKTRNAARHLPQRPCHVNNVAVPSIQVWRGAAQRCSQARRQHFTVLKSRTQGVLAQSTPTIPSTHFFRFVPIILRVAAFFSSSCLLSAPRLYCMTFRLAPRCATTSSALPSMTPSLLLSASP